MASGACLPVRARAAASPAPAPPPRPSRVPWLRTTPPADDSDGDDCAAEPPARALFDVVACAAPERRPRARATQHDEAAAVELGSLLRGLATSAAQGASPQARMLAVCRIVLAHVASWLKPAVDVPASALRMPAVIGTHTLRRVNLPSAAPGEADGPPHSAGPESMLLFQEQAVLRSVCFADQYLHASQHITASMRIHVKGGGMLLVFMDGAPAPPRDMVEERAAAAVCAAKLAAARAAATEAAEAAAEAEIAEAAAIAAEADGGADASPLAEVAAAAHLRAVNCAAAAADAAAAAVPPPPPPVQEAMTIQLEGASFYSWPKRWHLPPGAPVGTKPPPPLPSAARPASELETYRIRLPALKLSQLESATPGPVAAIVRSAVIECAATGLTARMRFVPFAPLRDSLRSVVIGHLGASDGAGGVAGAPRVVALSPPVVKPPPRQQVPRRRSLTRSEEGGSGGGALAGLTRRLRRTFSGRVVEEPIEEEAPPPPPAPAAAAAKEEATQPAAISAEAAAAALEAAPVVTIYGLWDGKVFADSAPLGAAAAAAAAATPAPQRAGGGLPAGPSGPLARRPSLTGAGSATSSAAAAPPPVVTPRPAPVLLYDDVAHVATQPLTGTDGAALVAAALRAPARMVQAMLWCAIADALREAVRRERCGASGAVPEHLAAWLQREGSEVRAAKRKPGGRRQQDYAASWLVATLPNTELPPALEHPAQPKRKPRAAPLALPAPSESAAEAGA